MHPILPTSFSSCPSRSRRSTLRLSGPSNCSSKEHETAQITDHVSREWVCLDNFSATPKISRHHTFTHALLHLSLTLIDFPQEVSIGFHSPCDEHVVEKNLSFTAVLQGKNCSDYWNAEGKFVPTAGCAAGAFSTDENCGLCGRNEVVTNCPLLLAGSLHLLQNSVRKWGKVHFLFPVANCYRVVVAWRNSINLFPSINLLYSV